MDSDTQAWIRNISDERAVAAGCRFDVERGEYVCNWIEKYLRLYEGEQAGEPLILGDWQRESTMRLFGWVRYSTVYKRWVRRFTKAGIWLPKKQAKTPTLAAWGLYLLAGDSEQGGKTFFAAIDGGQARIAARHAMEMVLASEALSNEIDINRNEMCFTHIKTRSIAKPISSGDSRAAKGKQGLNGSVLIDECHVIDRKFISESSINRAGISRSEPLHIEVSTAGKDPEGYGKSQYDYGKRVESGAADDLQFFFLCYEAPQSLTDEELAVDPLKWGRLANPAMGRIVHEEEYLADYNRSRDSLSDLADFKTYRLNIWQQAASPWLRIEDWNACRDGFTEDDMANRTCCAGLDLAKTRDTTALVLVFPWEEDRYRILSYFFLPEEGVRRIADKVRGLKEWAAAGDIKATPGDVTDYNFVKHEIKRLSEKFYIEKILFDPYNAEHLTQEINEEIGLERERFDQTVANFNEPTKEFERLVISRGIAHNGNPVMSWQIQHVNVKTDANNNKRPIKPPQDSVHKIDGVVAAIMGLAGAIRQSEAEHWYKPGSLRD